MRVAIIGAGALGSVLGSLLWRAGEDVVLVGRAAHVAAVRAAGLNVEGVLGGFNAVPHAEERLSTRPDLALLTVKPNDIVTALRENADMLQAVPIVVLQNGLRGEALAATVVPPGQLVSGVVALHARYLAPGHVVLLHSEGLLIGRPSGENDEVVERVRAVLDKAVPTSVSSDIQSARWNKLVATLGNVLPVLCNATFGKAYKDPLLRRLAAGLVREGAAVAGRAGIRLEPLSQGTAWQGRARVRPAGIDCLNDEIVRMGKALQVATPLNEIAVTLLQRVAAERRYLTIREIDAAFQCPELTLIAQRVV